MKKLIVLGLVLVLCLGLFAGCGKKDDLIGVWLAEGRESNGKEIYMYLYSDGTGDGYLFGYDFETLGDAWGHCNSCTWTVEKGYLVQEDAIFSSIIKYKISKNELYDSQGKLAYTKVSNDPTKDIK